jgi:hypothetical protein
MCDFFVSGICLLFCVYENGLLNNPPHCFSTVAENSAFCEI